MYMAMMQRIINRFPLHRQDTRTHLLRNTLYVSKNGFFCVASNRLAFFAGFLCMSYVEINAHIWFITLIAVFHHTEIDSSNVFLWHCNSNTSHIVAAIGNERFSFYLRSFHNLDELMPFFFHFVLSASWISLSNAYFTHRWRFCVHDDYI